MASDWLILKLQDDVNREIVAKTVERVLAESPEDIRSQREPQLRILQILWLRELSLRGEIAETPESLEVTLKSLEEFQASRAAAAERRTAGPAGGEGGEAGEGPGGPDQEASDAADSDPVGRNYENSTSSDEDSTQKLSSFERLRLARKRQASEAPKPPPAGPEPPRFKPGVRQDPAAAAKRVAQALTEAGDPKRDSHSGSVSGNLTSPASAAAAPPPEPGSAPASQAQPQAPAGKRDAARPRRNAQLDVADFLAPDSLTANVACGDTVSRGSFTGIDTLGTAQGDGRVTVQNGFLVAGGHTLYFERLGVGASQKR